MLSVNAGHCVETYQISAKYQLALRPALLLR